MTTSIQPETLQRQVREYTRVRPVYEVFEQILLEVLRRGLQELRLEATLESRVKTVPSFAEKLVRKPGQYVDPVAQVTDLCGLRVIVQHEEAIPRVEEYLRRRLWVDDPNSQDVMERLGESEFGYRSLHLVVALRPGVFDGEIRKALARMRRLKLANRSLLALARRRLFEERSKAQAGRLRLPVGPVFKAEIQVRTLLQHAWAATTHGQIYKGTVEPPKEVRRETSRVAAQLEVADDAFHRIVRRMRMYQTYYGPYRSRQERLDEIERLAEIHRHDPANRSLALAIARLALSVHDYNRARTVLAGLVEEWERTPSAPQIRRLAPAYDPIARRTSSPYHEEDLERIREDHADSRVAPLLMDYGVALWKLGQAKGRDYILWSTVVDPQFVDAFIELGDTHVGEGNRAGALACFERAYRLQPRNPRALRKYLRARIVCEQDASFVSAMVPILESAIETCRELARVQVYLPHAYFDIGFFRLLQGRIYDSLGAYARGVTLSHTLEPIEKAAGTVNEIVESVFMRPKPGSPPGRVRLSPDSEWEWVRRFFLLTQSAKLVHQVAAGHDLRVELKETLRRFASAGVADAGFTVTAADFDHVRKELEDQEAKVDAALKRLRSDLLPLLTRGFKLERTESIVIVAGGTRESEEKKIALYQPMMEAAFGRFRGTVFCPCTTVGVGRLTAELRARPELVRVAYRPRGLPRWVAGRTLSPQLARVYRAPSSLFSPIEPMQGWIDIMATTVLNALDELRKTLGRVRRHLPSKATEAEAWDFAALGESLGGLAPEFQVPGRVRLLGLNGGDVAGFEFRLALAMGAKTGVLPESGRAAKAILGDEDWKAAPGLVALPNDPATLEAFVCRVPNSAGTFGEPYREEKARLRHESHREDQINALARELGGTLFPWAKLAEHYRQSNREQVDHILVKLAAIGLCLKPRLEAEPVKRIELTPGQVEKVAELEHGRWVAERLLDGWRYAEATDRLKKVHRLLVPWDRLTDAEKQWDRDPVVDLVRELQEEGYGLLPVNPRAMFYRPVPGKAGVFHLIPRSQSRRSM